MIASLMLYAVIVGLALVLTGILLERGAAAWRRPRRWVWVAILCGLLGLTVAALMDLHLPRLLVGGSALAAGAGGSVTSRLLIGVHERLAAGADTAAATLAPLDGVAVGVWIAGSAAVLLLYVAGVRALRRERRRWRRASVRGVAVLLAPAIGPAVVGIRSPDIVLPEWALSLDADALDLMIRHEREHLRARDPLLVRLAGALLLATPWNPLVWWMVRRLTLAVEMDCDARVLHARGRGRVASGADRAAYGELLLTVATHQSPARLFATPAMLEHPSRLARRLAAMTGDHHRRPWIYVAAALGAAAVLMAIAVLVPVPQLRALASRAAPESRPPTIAMPVPVSGPTDGSAAAGTFGRGAYDLRGTSRLPNLTWPKPIHSVNPQYTREAMAEKIEGIVRLDIVIESDGTVGEVRITKSLDPVFGLDQAAVDAALDWQFEPARLDGTAVPVISEMEVEFRIH